MTGCPKCHYIRTPDDNHIPDGICPACGIAYNKYRAAQQAASAQTDEADDGIEVEYLPDETLKDKIMILLFDVSDRIDPVVFWSRAVCYVMFFIWGWWFIATDGSWIDIGSSFLHSVNLAFHEAGHVLFIPFGRFMTILGGSLFQIMVPLIVMIFFLRQHDNFEASIMLWWCGQNFIDISPYISDGEYRGLPLIHGLDESAHDWGNLLTMLDMVEKAYYFGRISFIIGSVIIIISLAWGAYVLWRQKKHTLPW